MGFKIKYPGNLIEKTALDVIYRGAGEVFDELYPLAEKVADAEAALTERWDAEKPRSRAEFEEFYRDSLLVPQELVQWHSRNGFRRSTRAMVSGSIARALGCDTFAEYGCGVGSDAVALTKQGLTPRWLCDINRHNRSITKRMFSRFTGFNPPVFDVLGSDMREQKKTDLLYSSDVFEHIHDLEGFLTPWVEGFKVVIIYAPFGSNSVQHQHTSYPARRFHRFMAGRGYQKIVFNLAIPPFVYLGKAFTDRPRLFRLMRK